MSLFLQPGATAIAAAVVFGALSTGSATAGEYCRQGAVSHMTDCSFSSMEQCKATSAGIGGDCFRDPWLGYNNPGNAFGQTPKAPNAAKGAQRGNAASRGN